MIYKYITATIKTDLEKIAGTKCQNEEKAIMVEKIHKPSVSVALSIKPSARSFIALGITL